MPIRYITLEAIPKERNGPGVFMIDPVDLAIVDAL